MKLKRFQWIVMIIIVIGVISLIRFLATPENATAGKYDVLAQCLRDKGVTMYGADWCPHCQNEKNAFGSSFDFIPYVECSADPERCLSKKIDGYPTWIFSDGKRLIGEQGPKRLAEESECSMLNPNNN